MHERRLVMQVDCDRMVMVLIPLLLHLSNISGNPDGSSREISEVIRARAVFT